MHLRQRLSISVIALVMTSALTACGGDSVEIPTGDGGSVKVDSKDDGGFKVDSEDGSLVGGSGSLPEGYPTDEAPVVPGDVLSGIAIDTADQKGFTVAITPSGKEDLDSAVALLTAKGFTIDGTFDMGISKTAQLSSPTWEVLVALTETDGSRTFTYTVARAGS